MKAKSKKKCAILRLLAPKINKTLLIYMRYKKSVSSVFDDLLFQDLFHSGEENIPLQNMIIGQFDFL